MEIGKDFFAKGFIYFSNRCFTLGYTLHCCCSIRGLRANSLTALVVQRKKGNANGSGSSYKEGPVVPWHDSFLIHRNPFYPCSLRLGFYKKYFWGERESSCSLKFFSFVTFCNISIGHYVGSWYQITELPAMATRCSSLWFGFTIFTQIQEALPPD